MHVVAGDRIAPLDILRGAALRFDDPALRVDEHLTQADAAVQLVLVGRLDAELADVVRTGVGRPIEIGARLVALRDRADVADCMDCRTAERIPAPQSRADVDAGELLTSDGEAGHFLLVELKTQRYRLEAALAAQQLSDARVVLFAHEAELAQPLERRRDVRDLLGGQLQLVGRQVFRQHDAVAIEDQPAGRRHRLDADPVAAGQVGEMLVLEHLQVDQPADQQQQQAGNDHGGGDRAGEESAPLGPVILDANCVIHAVSGPLRAGRPGSSTAATRAAARPDRGRRRRSARSVRR